MCSPVHCSICRPSHSNVSKDDGIEPRTVVQFTGTVRVANQPATTYPLSISTNLNIYTKAWTDFFNIVKMSFAVFRPKLSSLARERSVPSTRLSRVLSFGSLGVGLGKLVLCILFFVLLIKIRMDPYRFVSSGSASSTTDPDHQPQRQIFQKSRCTCSHTVGAQSIARLCQNLINCRRNI
jgi:hypothetical protein